MTKSIAAGFLCYRMRRGIRTPYTINSMNSKLLPKLSLALGLLATLFLAACDDDYHYGHGRQGQSGHEYRQDNRKENRNDRSEWRGDRRGDRNENRNDRRETRKVYY